MSHSESNNLFSTIKQLFPQAITALVGTVIGLIIYTKVATVEQTQLAVQVERNRVDIEQVKATRYTDVDAAKSLELIRSYLENMQDQVNNNRDEIDRIRRKIE